MEFWSLLENQKTAKKLKNRVFHKNCFFHNSGWNWGGLGVSGRIARSIRNFSLELWQDLVLLDVRKSTFQHLTVNWNFNVLEMALKTLHFVQGLSRVFPGHLYYLFLDISPTYFSKIFSQKKKSRESKIWKSEISKKPGYQQVPRNLVEMFSLI